MFVRRIGILALGAVLLASAWGCHAKEPDVVTPWPDADRERSMAQPAGSDRWPLTGAKAPSPDAVAARVVSVKIENSREARPQTNVQLADVVYETVTEGGITRFNALFHSQAPTVVGPVRSARLSDIDIVSQYKALLCFSGASRSVNSAIKAAGVDNLSEDAGITKPFTRSRQRPRPHNLYVSVPELRAEAARRGMATTADVKGLAFDHSSSPATPTVTTIEVPFSTSTKVRWTYDPQADVYMRADNGTPSPDASTGKQISARNVVVMWAKYRPASRDKVGSTTYDIELVGSGRATVFKGGAALSGTWEASADSPPLFKAEDGSQIRLAPGNTWMEVVNTSVNIIMK